MLCACVCLQPLVEPVVATLYTYAKFQDSIAASTGTASRPGKSLFTLFYRSELCNMVRACVYTRGGVECTSVCGLVRACCVILPLFYSILFWFWFFCWPQKSKGFKLLLYTGFETSFSLFGSDRMWPVVKRCAVDDLVMRCAAQWCEVARRLTHGAIDAVLGRNTIPSPASITSPEHFPSRPIGDSALYVHVPPSP